MINRELKIGLLLAMGFVLLVSVVVGEYVTTSNSPEPADLASTGANIRTSVKTPGTNVFDNPTVQVPAAIEPGELVATRDRLDLPPESAVTQTPVVSAMLSATAPQLNAPMPLRDPEPTQVIPAQPTLEDVAREVGEPIVALTQPVSASPVPVVPASKPYVAVKGDSLSKMARLHLGSDTPANRSAITALNPDLLSNPDRIVVGKTYLIPSRDTQAVIIQTPPPAVASTPTAPTQADSTGTTVSYTVQPGDSLWKIASKVVGDINKLDEIRALNKDALGGADRLKPGMSLVLPATN